MTRTPLELMSLVYYQKIKASTIVQPRPRLDVVKFIVDVVMRVLLPPSASTIKPSEYPLCLPIGEFLSVHTT